MVRLALLALALAALAAAGPLAAASREAEERADAAPPDAFYDHTLSQAGPTCVARFYKLVAQLYPGDSHCPELVQRALAAAQPAACPPVEVGSRLQRCMNASTVGVQRRALR